MVKIVQKVVKIVQKVVKIVQKVVKIVPEKILKCLRTIWALPWFFHHQGWLYYINILNLHSGSKHKEKLSGNIFENT